MGPTLLGRSHRHPPSAGVALVLLGAVWVYGVVNAVRRGFDPGYWGDFGTWAYPFGSVAIVIAIVSAETVGLYFVLRPDSFYRSWLRLLAAALYTAGLFYVDALIPHHPSHEPGYAYANFEFLVVVVMGLALGFAMQMLEAGHRYEPAAPRPSNAVGVMPSNRRSS